MLNIGKYSLIVPEESSGNFILSRILDYYDLMGLNLISFYKDDDIKHFLNKREKYRNVGDLLKLIETNLFKLDCILIQSDYDILKYVRKVTDLPIILVSDSATFKEGIFDNRYSLYIERKDNDILNREDVDSEYYVRDLNKNTVISLSELKKSHVRDFKINLLFNK